MAEGGLQLAAGLVEALELQRGEAVEVVAVATHEMAEDGAGDDGRLAVEATDEPVDVVLGVETQAVHTGVKLDVYGPSRDALLLGGMDEGLHETEGIDFGFQVVVEHVGVTKLGKVSRLSQWSPFQKM